MDPTILARWKRAVIHLETAADSISKEQRLPAFDAVREAMERGEATPEEVERVLLKGSWDLRFTGTAVFLRHEGRHFLVTARHVLFDQTKAEPHLEALRAQMPQSDQEDSDRVAQFLQWLLERRVFGIVFRVPSLDEVLRHGRGSTPEFLMNLGAGLASETPYSFSSPDLDLAVISLDHRFTKNFSEELITVDYEPISFNEVASGPSAEGAEVFTVGYPYATTTIDHLDLDERWRSSLVSLPSYAFGRVAMLHKQLPYFWCDLSIYPGNSGGPVIERGKLVGIVSGQALIPIDQPEDEATAKGSVRIPFGKIIKAEYLRPLLQEQMEKDDRLKERDARRQERRKSSS